MSTRAFYIENYRKTRLTSPFREIVVSVCLAILFSVSLAAALTHPPTSEDLDVFSKFGP